MTAYVASKHGVLGLLRASQSAARDLGVRVNAIAPFLTPTHITAGFAQGWKDHGLEVNTTERVAEAIALVALDEMRHGECVLVRCGTREHKRSGLTRFPLGRWKILTGTRVVSDEAVTRLDWGRCCRVYWARDAVFGEHWRVRST